MFGVTEKTSILGSRHWQPEVMAGLDEKHLVAWSDRPRLRSRFAAELYRFLSLQPRVETVVLHGRSITSMDHLCDQIERQIPGPDLHREIDGPYGLTELLRSNESWPGQLPPRARYLIWNDADVLLKSDPSLFGRIVDALIGVAAESEFSTTHRLLLQRAVFTGGPMLERYARDQRGQFRCWMAEGNEEPFWQLVSGLDIPPVMTKPVDLLMERTHRETA